MSEGDKEASDCMHIFSGWDALTEMPFPTTFGGFHKD